MKNKLRLLLDTHIWIWLANGDPKLSTAARKSINNAQSTGTLFIPSISVWELCMLEAKHRLTLSNPPLEWITHSLEKTNCQIAHLTPEIAAESCHLPGDFHDDPADRIIVATARVEDLLLVTADKKIENYSKKNYLSVLAARK